MRVVLLFITILFISCNNRMIETTLYFGQTRPGGAAITEAEWRSFAENRIATTLKEGYTIIRVSGSWFDPEAKILISEPTYVVVYLHRNSAHISGKIDSLKQWYKTQFDQQSVLRVDKKVRATF